MEGEYKLHIHINAHYNYERYVQHAGFQLADSAMHSMLMNKSSVVINFYNLYMHLIAVYWVTLHLFCIIYSTAL